MQLHVPVGKRVRERKENAALLSLEYYRDQVLQNLTQKCFELLMLFLTRK